MSYFEVFWVLTGVGAGVLKFCGFGAGIFKKCENVTPLIFASYTMHGNKWERNNCNYSSASLKKSMPSALKNNATT